MYKLILRIVIVFFVSASLTATFAKGTTHQCYCKPFDKMINLNLTPEQETKILTIRKQTRDNLQGTYTELKALQSQINNLITSATMDDSKLNALINQKKELLAAVMKARIKMRNQIYNLLDDNQKASYVKIMDRREARKVSEIQPPSSPSMPAAASQNSNSVPNP